VTETKTTKRKVVRKPADERIANGLKRLSIGEFESCAAKFVELDEKAASYFFDRLGDALGYNEDGGNAPQ
jgi:hypothetical protein